MIFSPVEIQETVNMFMRQKLDIRCITMGISLLDCADSDSSRACQKIYDKVMRCAGKLVQVGQDIEKEFGVPIINKRISVTPIALVAGASGATSYVDYCKTLNRCAQELGVNFIGGFSALVQKGITPADKILIDSIPEALAVTDYVCSSVNVGTTKNGINMNAVKLMGETIKKTAEASKDCAVNGCAKLVVFTNAPEDNPFMAGAFHGPGEGDAVINVGVSGPGVILAAAKEFKGRPINELADGIKKMADLMAALRKAPPERLAGIKVKAYIDYSVPEKYDLKKGTKEKLPGGTTNSLYYILGDDVVVIRPSGTEPKIKFYCMATGDTAEKAAKKLERFRKIPDKLIREYGDK